MRVAMFGGSAQIDPFFLYRKCLVVFCLIYTLIRTSQSLVRWMGFLSRPGRSHRLLRHYLSLSLLRLSPRRFGRDLLQIVVLLAIVVGLLWLHRFVQVGQP